MIASDKVLVTELENVFIEGNINLREIDCLIVKQPYASLIAYGSKRWEFRTYNCEKRGVICIGSSKGKPMKTGDSYLNSVATSFPRGFALSVGILTDSFMATGKHLEKALQNEENAIVHGYKIRTASKPLGEPVVDILKAIKDRDWRMYVWAFESISPLKTMIPLQNSVGGSTWTKITLHEEEPFSRSLESYF